MAAIFRPKRGTASAAANLILESGELFCEYTTQGIGKTYGKMKMGDGITRYEDLPYFLEMMDSEVASDLTPEFSAQGSSFSDCESKFVSGSKISTLFGVIKGYIGFVNSKLQNVSDSLTVINQQLQDTPVTSHTHVMSDISDLPDWVKDNPSGKPSYSYNEIQNTPTLGTQATMTLEGTTLTITTIGE